MDRVGEKQLYPPKDPLFPLNERKGSLAVVGREEGLGDEWQTPTPPCLFLPLRKKDMFSLRSPIISGAGSVVRECLS